VSRMVAWTNVVVPLMTPRTIPYRGFEGIANEIGKSFQVASVAGLTADDLLDAGMATAPARTYGFMVNSQTSVEFTVAADGWSRGGAAVTILFFVILALALTIGEACIYSLCRSSPGAATFLVLPLARAAFFDVNALPLLATLRSMVMYTVLIGLAIVVVEAARHTGDNVVRKRSARLLRPSATRN
jgi:hypothetical protein